MGKGEAAGGRAGKCQDGAIFAPQSAGRWGEHRKATSFMTLSAPVSKIFVEDHPVALLIDGENIAARHAQTILKQARQLGEPRLRRVYGDAALLKGWDAEPEVDLIHTRCGKNSADMRSWP
jgi:hypothetical protein